MITFLWFLTTKTKNNEMMKRKYRIALFAVAWIISVCLLLQYWKNVSNGGKKTINGAYFSAHSTYQNGNSVDTRAAVTNRTTAEVNGKVNSTSLNGTKNAASSSGDLSNVIYLTQTESCLAPHLLRPDVFGYGCKNDVLVLSWKQPCVQNLTHFKHIKHIYKPNNSWSEGRNILYRLAKEMPKNYLYYVFMDDDMTFDFTNSDFSKRYRDLGISSPLKAFEDFLLKHEPAIAVPMYRTNGKLDKMFNLKPIPEYLPVTIYFDAAFTAFHKNALNLMLPYRLDYEKKSWWQSQKYVILAADLIFRGQVLRFGPITAFNSMHREYPRWDSDNWAHIYNILKEEMPTKFRDQVDWKPNYNNIDVMPVVQDDTVITPMWKMKIPTGRITVEPYKHLKTP